jgi:putative ubiquitin-RnfH superfamily antitoxin RatB of RatAB toxin-antitoxin module
MAMPENLGAQGVGNAAAASIALEVVYSPGPRLVHHHSVQLPAGCQLAQALPAIAEALGVPLQVLTALEIGIWGIRCPPERVLVHGERVEFYRPLRVDPKVARRERFVRQGAKAAGLFAKKRPGAKAGY